VDTVICFDWQKVKDDEAARGEILREINQFKPDLILNSTYSSESVTEVLIHAQQAPEVIAIDGDLSNISAQDRADCSVLMAPYSPPGELKPEREWGQTAFSRPWHAADVGAGVWTSPRMMRLARRSSVQLDARIITLFPGAKMSQISSVILARSCA
jgi:hypothetical protein